MPICARHGVCTNQHGLCTIANHYLRHQREGYVRCRLSPIDMICSLQDVSSDCFLWIWYVRCRLSPMDLFSSGCLLRNSHDHLPRSACTHALGRTEREGEHEREWTNVMWRLYTHANTCIPCMPWPFIWLRGTSANSIPRDGKESV